MAIAKIGQHLVQVAVCVALLLAQSALAAAGVAASGVRPTVFALPNDVIATQAAPGLNNPQRNCQTLRNCQYSKGGSFRGCVSSYSCRNCRYVTSRCSVGATSGQCQRQVCEWG